MGMWIPDPNLEPEEAVVATVNANRTQEARAIGGRLFMTTTHLRFVANRLDRILGGRDIAIRRGDVTSTSVADRSSEGGPFSGGARRRLEVEARGKAEPVVVNGVDEVVIQMQA